MKKYVFQIGALLIFVVMLTSCPYTSKIPIDEANIKIDKKLIGKWIKASEADKDNPKFYEFQKSDKLKYKIVENEYNTSDSAYTQTNYIGHISKIDAILFLNMQKNGEGDYYLHKIEMIGDKIIHLKN